MFVVSTTFFLFDEGNNFFVHVCVCVSGRSKRGEREIERVDDRYDEDHTGGDSFSFSEVYRESSRIY